MAEFGRWFLLHQSEFSLFFAVFAAIIVGLARRPIAVVLNAFAVGFSIPTALVLVFSISLGPEALSHLNVQALAMLGLLFLVQASASAVEATQATDVERARNSIAVLGRMVGSTMTFLLDIAIYIGWAIRQVEFSALPADRQVRLKRIRDSSYSSFLLVVAIGVCLYLFIALTLVSLTGGLSK